MTASSPTRSSLQDVRPTWQTSSALGNISGIPWWAAIVLALAFAAIGVFADIGRIYRLGIIFQVCYFAGCLLAVLWVQRRGLFGPMVQPPLIMTATVPGVVLLMGGQVTGSGVTAKALAIGTPLINGFPTMAVTTGLTVIVGCLRLLRQRPPDTKRQPPQRRRSRRSPRPG